MGARKKKTPSTGTALLQGILANPDEDTYRLVYADWLEENGQSLRGEFIRVQCALARIAGDDPARFGLAQREHELLSKHGSALEIDLPAVVRDHFQCDMHRGFIEEVRTTATYFLKGAGGLLRRTPLRVAELRYVDAAQLAAFSGLARLSGLSLSNLYAAGLETLAASPHLTGLKELRVYWVYDCTADRFLELLAFPAFAKLTDLTFCGLAGTGVLWRVATAPACAALTAFTYAGALNTDDVRALAQSPHVARLTTLKLFNHTNAGAGILPLLAGSPHLAGLTTLTIDSGGIPEADIEALAATPYLRNLTDLSLGWVGLTPSGWEKLLRSPNLPRLTRLHAHGWDYKVPTAMGLKTLPNTKGIMWVWVPR